MPTRLLGSGESSVPAARSLLAALASPIGSSEADLDRSIIDYLQALDDAVSRGSAGVWVVGGGVGPPAPAHGRPERWGCPWAGSRAAGRAGV